MSMFTDNTGKLQPFWAFVFSIILSAVAFVVSGNIATEIVGPRTFLFELIFRPLWLLLLFGIFNWLLTVGDHVEEHRIAAQGLPRTKGWLSQFLLGCLLGCLLTVIAVVPIHFWGEFRSRSFLTVQLLPKVGAALIMLLCGALAEELMFRGYPFQQLVKGMGAVRAIIVFSILYGFLHLLNPGAGAWGIANTVLIGIVLSIAYLRTRALWLPWGIHFAWNTTLGFLMGMPVSGFRYFNVIRRTYTVGPTWVTGGTYGIEASLTCAAAIVLGIVAVSLLPLRKLEQPAPLPEPRASQHLTSIKP